jgi:hypothetical protein
LHVACADPSQVKPGNQLLDALRPTQIGRQDLRGEGFRLVDWPAIPNSRLGHLKWAKGSDNRTSWQPPIANNLLTPLSVLQMRSGFEPVGDLGFDGIGQQSLGSTPEHFRQCVLRRRD